MRRNDRALPTSDALAIINHCSFGVLSTLTPDGHPYGVPLSLVRVGQRLYFHCALEGVKVDSLRHSPHVSITFVGNNQAAEDKFTTYFQSAIVTGTAREVLDDQEKIEALRALCLAFTPKNMVGDNFERAIAKSLSITGVWCIEIEHITGKAKLPT